MITDEQFLTSNELPIPYVGVWGEALEPKAHTIPGGERRGRGAWDPYLAQGRAWSLEATIIYTYTRFHQLAALSAPAGP